ncbi:hypothetical protein L596_025311 [Steinernema carpocapsae]|uniref:Uncharacterized protein n=1 Tax=Steinernema carpocapsae TaxID=34508 RepID=A0A4U5M895_STECR|nr:hypothetical protein L596_025311 [Steinernema carpocapsae]
MSWSSEQGKREEQRRQEGRKQREARFRAICGVCAAFGDCRHREISSSPTKSKLFENSEGRAKEEKPQHAKENTKKKENQPEKVMRCRNPSSRHRRRRRPTTITKGTKTKLYYEKRKEAGKGNSEMKDIKPKQQKRTAKETRLLPPPHSPSPLLRQVVAPLTAMEPLNVVGASGDEVAPKRMRMKEPEIFDVGNPMTIQTSPEASSEPAEESFVATAVEPLSESSPERIYAAEVLFTPPQNPDFKRRPDTPEPSRGIVGRLPFEDLDAVEGLGAGNAFGIEDLDGDSTFEDTALLLQVPEEPLGVKQPEF